MMRKLVVTYLVSVSISPYQCISLEKRGDGISTKLVASVGGDGDDVDDRLTSDVNL